MSRTFRTNKYGDVKTDKFKKNFNGCGCVYCEYKHTDFRDKHIEKLLDVEIKEGEDYIENKDDEIYQ
jgi:hypothetical protein